MTADQSEYVEFDCAHVCCEPDAPPHEHVVNASDCETCKWAASSVIERVLPGGDEHPYWCKCQRVCGGDQ